MLRRVGEPDRLGSAIGRLGELTDLGEGQEQPGAIHDRGRQGQSETFVVPAGGKRREIVGGQIDDPLVVASRVVGELEIRRRGDPEFQVFKSPGDLQRGGAGHQGLIQPGDERVRDREDGEDMTAPGVVVETLGECLRLAEMLEHATRFPEVREHRRELQANRKSLLERR
jgi:hypothetical protein